MISRNSTDPELYDMQIHQKISVPDYLTLKTMVKRSIDQKLQSRNLNARHGRIGTRAVVKNREPVTSGKTKGSNAVSCMRVTIVRKNQNTLPPHLRSHPRHEVEVCLGMQVSEAKVTMVLFFDNLHAFAL